jgi:hypothetical protein
MGVLSGLVGRLEKDIAAGVLDRVAPGGIAIGCRGHRVPVLAKEIASDGPTGRDHEELADPLGREGRYEG